MGSFAETLIDPLTLHVLRMAKIQPRTQACSRYPSDQRRLGTERDSARRPRRIFPTSLTGDVTSEIAEDDWERGLPKLIFSLQYPYILNRKGHENKQNDHLRENALFFYKFSHPIF